MWPALEQEGLGESVEARARVDVRARLVARVLDEEARGPVCSRRFPSARGSARERFRGHPPSLEASPAVSFYRSKRTRFGIRTGHDVSIARSIYFTTWLNGLQS